LAYVFLSTDDDFQFNTGDLDDYMFNNGATSWLGFNGGAAGFNNSEAQIWMDWPGFTGGTANGSQVLTTTVDQATYLFNSVTLPAGEVNVGDTVYPAIVIPVSSMNSDTYQIDEIGYDYDNGGFDPTSVNSTVSGVLVTYSGSYWPSGDYRVYYSASLPSNTNSSFDYIWKGNTKTP